MFAEAYPAVYRDGFGEVATTLFNDGKECSCWEEVRVCLS